MTKRLSLPLRVARGRLSTVTQGGQANVQQSLALLLSTRPGERRGAPDYGLRDALYSGLDEESVAAVAMDWEPRALDLQVWVSTPGTDQQQVEVAFATDVAEDLTVLRYTPPTEPDGPTPTGGGLYPSSSTWASQRTYPRGT